MTVPKPVLLVLAVDTDSASRVAAELERRYAGDYEVRGEGSPAALGLLDRLKVEQRQVAVVLVDRGVAVERGSAVLARCRERHPTAKRALLVAAGDDEAAAVILRLMALGPRRRVRPGAVAVAGRASRMHSTTASPPRPVSRWPCPGSSRGSFRWS